MNENVNSVTSHAYEFQTFAIKIYEKLLNCIILYIEHNRSISWEITH